MRYPKRRPHASQDTTRPRLNDVITQLKFKRLSTAAYSGEISMLRLGFSRPAFTTFRRSLSAAAYAKQYKTSKGEPISEEDASLAPGVQTLAARLNLTDIPKATLARTMVGDTATTKYANNAGLAKFGKTLLNFYVYAHFMKLYPRLPSSILRQLVWVYTSLPQLARIGSQWGVAQDTRSAVKRYLADVQDTQTLGRLTFTPQTTEVEAGVEQITNGTTSEIATGVFVRALVAAVYSHRGLDGVHQFIDEAIVRPRQVDVRQLMVFSRPTRELAVLCERQKMEAPVSRLIAESGRYSSTPVFVVGVYSGSSKLGEGQGSSINEARTRAAVNALQGWYLYSPVGGNHLDPGQVII